MKAPLLAGAAWLALLAGCGQKGPLYLPDKHATAVTSAPATPAPAPSDPSAKKKPSDDADADGTPPPQ